MGVKDNPESRRMKASKSKGRDMHSTLCYASPIEFENEWENTLAKAAA
jgi:hypothetical protein